VAAQADPKLRTYAARFTLDAPPSWLALGMTAMVSLDWPGNSPVATLPVAALADRGQGPIVWTVDQGSGALAAHPVAVVALRQTTAVVGGLWDGALVVSVGVQKLDSAARVRVAEVRPAPSAPLATHASE
jgi:hypothetical protein